MLKPCRGSVSLIRGRRSPGKHRPPPGCPYGRRPTGKDAAVGGGDTALASPRFPEGSLRLPALGAVGADVGTARAALKLPSAAEVAALNSPAVPALPAAPFGFTDVVALVACATSAIRSDSHAAKGDL